MSKTKAQVLSAAEEITDVVEFEEHDWYPTVRSLTDSEFNRAQAQMFKGQKVEAEAGSEDGFSNVEFDLGMLLEGEFDARVAICAFGLSVGKSRDDRWSREEVRRIPYAGAIQKISDKVLELGGHDLYEGLTKGARLDVETFRKDRGGNGDSGTPDAGDTSGEGSDVNDDNTEGLSARSYEESRREAAG